MIEEINFLQTIGAGEKKGKGSEPPLTRLGKIPNEYVSGDPSVIFDGELTPTIKKYKCCRRYTPAAGDDVILVRVGNGYVIFDAIDSR